VVFGVPEDVRKQQEAERKFQEAEQQRKNQEFLNQLAELRAQREESL
jgi:molecular chaperone GrpE (heat shock protein)